MIMSLGFILFFIFWTEKKSATERKEMEENAVYIFMELM